MRALRRAVTVFTVTVTVTVGLAAILVLVVSQNQKGNVFATTNLIGRSLHSSISG